MAKMKKIKVEVNPEEKQVSWSKTVAVLLKLVYDLDPWYFLIMIASALVQAATIF